MGLMFVITGLLVTGVALIAWLTPAVRDVEALIPDHDAGGRAATATAEAAAP
jgi:hypothetical protein